MRIIVTRWQDLGNGNHEIHWTEWDGLCLCTAIKRSGVIKLPEFREDYSKEIRRKYYDNHSRYVGAGKIAGA